MFYIVLLGVAVVSSVGGFLIGKKVGGAREAESKKEGYFSVASPDELRDIQGGAQEALDERTQKRKEKILRMIRNETETQKKLEDCSGTEEAMPGITRVDVEELLEVSEGTARKYLNMLEDEGKIQQIGESGRGVRYVE